MLDYMNKFRKLKIAESLEKSRFSTTLETGDEGIEPPPKVLETPIIPFDQSPITQKKAFAFPAFFRIP